MDQVILRVRRKRTSPALSAIVAEPPIKRSHNSDEPPFTKSVFHRVYSGPVTENYRKLTEVAKKRDEPMPCSSTNTSLTPAPSSSTRLKQTSSSSSPLFIPGAGFIVDAEFHCSEDDITFDYEYDYYLANPNLPLNSASVGYVQIEPFSFGDAEYSDHDSEDSNAEDYFGNDYPDEDVGFGMPDYNDRLGFDDGDSSSVSTVVSSDEIDFDKDWFD
ncbi:hypothetical protein GEMRC1_008098 [Eukaryota sp. GEM-RC1]